MSKYNRQQGDRVYFEMGGPQLPRGFAKICGCSSEPLPVLGRQWIVELEIPLTTYPFTHIVLFDSQIKPAPTAIIHQA